MNQKISIYEKLTGENNMREQNLEELLLGYVPNEKIENEVCQILKTRSGQSLKNQKRAEVKTLFDREQEQTEELRSARNSYIFIYSSVQC